MARKLKKKTELKSQSTEDQKEFLDPATTALVGTVAWFSFKAIAQTIVGWIGLNYYIKLRDWWKNRGKVDKRDSTKVSTEESAASS
tara:strand:+ start:130 stop:387 length:258 start_codon:yes stop_codon:yes gene_type:complete